MIKGIAKFGEWKNMDNVKMTHTGLIQGKKGKYIHVCFEREQNNKIDYAEIVLPERKVIKCEGFDEGEIAQLKLYLKGEEKNIIETAKQLNHDLIFKL